MSVLGVRVGRRTVEYALCTHICFVQLRIQSLYASKGDLLVLRSSIHEPNNLLRGHGAVWQGHGGWNLEADQAGRHAGRAEGIRLNTHQKL